MLRKLAAIAIAPLMIVLAVPAHADPSTYEEANNGNLLQVVAQDGFVMNPNEVIQEAYAVCKLMQPPNDGSLWDATQLVKSFHPGWRTAQAMTFADRSVQNICPHRGSF